MKKALSITLILGLIFSSFMLNSNLYTETQAISLFGNWKSYTDTSWYYNVIKKDKNAKEFEINNARQLAGLAKLVNEGNTFNNNTIKLVNNIGLGQHKWTPIGTTINPFKGRFDGQGYTITNMKIGSASKVVSKDYVGLFGYIENATIQNVTIGEGSDIYANSISVGGICGYATNRSLINKCKNMASINNSAEGLRGIGGICGTVSPGQYGRTCINKCVNEGNISANFSLVGGICGILSGEGDFFISSCSNKGNLSSEHTVAGGIYGIQSSINNCYIYVNSCSNIGSVYGAYKAVGICGSFFAQHINNSTLLLYNSFNAGEIKSSLENGAVYAIFDNTSLNDYMDETSNYYKLVSSPYVIGGIRYHSMALPESQMKAAAGATAEDDWVEIDGIGRVALVDALNDWVKANNTEGNLLSWIQNANENNGYPYLDLNNN